MAHDQDEEDSVYDFIYADNRRIVQYLSQFSSLGHLTGLTRVDGKASTGGGGINVAAAKIDKSTSTTENQTRSFDPQWLSPLKLLDELYQRDLIIRDIANANVGNFVLASGQIVLLDLAMLKTAWGNPTIQKLIKAGQKTSVQTSNSNRKDRRVAAKQKDSQVDNEFELLIALLSMLPHTLQARVIGTNVNLWCTLDEASVVGRSSDLVLKHGALLDGTWNVLGVLDALPYDPNYVSDDGQAAEDILANIAETMIGQLAARLAPVARNILGRPPTAHGITPVLIFRDTVDESGHQATEFHEDADEA